MVAGGDKKCKKSKILAVFSNVHAIHLTKKKQTHKPFL